MVCNLQDALIVIEEQNQKIKKNEELVREAFYAGRTVVNYKGTWVDDLDIDDYTSAKYPTFEDWLLEKNIV